MHRKEVTHSDGSYERKSRGRKLADEMGRGKKKSHYTLIDWRTRREWPLNWMTVISARWRSHRPFQRKRKWPIPVARYRKELRRHVHITAWEFEGNIRLTNWTEDSWVPVSWVQRASRQTGEKEDKQYSWRQMRCSKESQCSGWAAMENEKDTTLTAITSGSKYFSYVRSPPPSHTQTLSNPFRNLTNKVRGKIFHKEVFLRLSVCVVFFLATLSLCVCLIIYCVVMMLHEHVYVYKSIFIMWVYNMCDLVPVPAEFFKDSEWTWLL